MVSSVKLHHLSISVDVRVAVTAKRVLVRARRLGRYFSPEHGLFRLLRLGVGAPGAACGGGFDWRVGAWQPAAGTGRGSGSAAPWDCRGACAHVASPHASADARAPLSYRPAYHALPLAA